MPEPLPLALYVHVPWCVRKCPYCDFNSHPLREPLPEAAFVDALIADLEHELPRVWGRPLDTLFIGGGTPSLLSVAAIERLLSAVRARLRLRPGAEITLEANPGTVDQARFHGYREAGINRLSLGVQSFDDHLLTAIGRIHNGRSAHAAIEAARAAGFDNLNLDLMFGLPGQRPEGAEADLDAALSHAPEHLSRYQLTIEPNTAFGAAPPPLPDDEPLWQMHQLGRDRLEAAGYRPYEVSAWARPGRQSRHNLNYWHFGDYLGIGPGAHGKLTHTTEQGVLQVERHHRVRHPRDYLARAARGEATTAGREAISGPALALEFLINGLRLHDGVERDLFSRRTGLPLATIAAELAEAQRRGLMRDDPDRLAPTEKGRRYLDDLLGLFV